MSGASLGILLTLKINGNRLYFRKMYVNGKKHQLSRARANNEGNRLTTGYISVKGWLKINKLKIERISKQCDKSTCNTYGGNYASLSASQDLFIKRIGTTAIGITVQSSVLSLGCGQLPATDNPNLLKVLLTALICSMCY